MPLRFDGRSILIVEDEPLIAIDLVQAFQDAGAKVTMATTLEKAQLLVEDEHLSCAVLDHALRDGDSTELCRRLTERGIPFVIYSGWGNLEGPCAAGEFVRKPASTDALIAKVEAALPPDSASA